MRHKFDLTAFSKALKTKRVIELDIDIRTAAKKAKVGIATISRVENGNIPEMETFIKLCNWIGANPSQFFISDETIKIRKRYNQIKNTLP